MQVLQIFSPMGHALGLSVVSARLDDLALTVLFGTVYSDMRDWMARQQRHWTSLLGGMQLQVQQALDACPELEALAAVACVSTRAKSAYSLMKKLATLSGTPALCSPGLPPSPLRCTGCAAAPAALGCSRFEAGLHFLPDELPACSCLAYLDPELCMQHVLSAQPRF